MNKRILLSTLFAMAVGFSANVYAQETTPVVPATPSTQGPNFVDKDGDGICDNYTANHGKNGQRKGKGFVDANGDGICDNAGSGKGMGAGKGSGTGCTGTGTCTGQGKGKSQK